jgi:tryptophan 2,3-dioxygenase
VEILEDGMRQKFFPELWEIRGEMTDRWGAEYGTKRDPLGGHH